MKIGIDIGNVIIGGGDKDTFFTENYMYTPQVVDAWSSLDNLRKANHELHLISKCGKKVEEKSMMWLRDYAYFFVVPQHRIHFVRHRELKSPMTFALELDIFIDDREDIIEWMQFTVQYPILFKSWEQTNAELKAIFEKEKVK